MSAEKAEDLMKEQRFDDALQVWREVVVSGPPNARWRIQMARCLLELGAEQEAREELETARALDTSGKYERFYDIRFLD